MHPDGFIKKNGGHDVPCAHHIQIAALFIQAFAWLKNASSFFHSSGNGQAIIDEVFDHRGFGQG